MSKEENERLVFSTSLYFISKVVDDFIAGKTNETDSLRLLLAMSSSYKQSLTTLLGEPKNEHQSISFSLFKMILETIERDKKLPTQFGDKIINELILMLCKQFKEQINKIQIEKDYTLKGI